MDKEIMKNLKGTTIQKVDDAVGVPNLEKREWFVAIVINRSEKKYAQVLHDKGYEIFVPIQSEKHTWRNGVIKTVDRVLIVATSFVHCTENERKDIVNMPFVKRFMVDQSQKDNAGKHPIARIPEEQIETFRKLLEKAEEPITIESLPLNVGDKVKVIRGKFTGIEGRILQQRCGETFLIIEINLLGCAKLVDYFSSISWYTFRLLYTHSS